MLLAQKRTVHYLLNGLKEANTGFYNSPKKKKERKKKQQFLKTENAFFAASKDFFIQKINGYMEHHRKVYILATYFHSLLNRGTSTRKQVLCSHPLKCFTRVYWRKATRRWLSNVSPLIWNLRTKSGNWVNPTWAAHQTADTTPIQSWTGNQPWYKISRLELQHQYQRIIPELAVLSCRQAPNA